MRSTLRHSALALAALLLVSTVALAGAKGGPKSNTTVVKANTTDVYTISFVAGQTARVEVNGDGDSDLDVYVYDENGNLITKDDDNTDDCLVTWTPKWTGKFTIKVVNRGVANRYTIKTN